MRRLRGTVVVLLVVAAAAAGGAGALALYTFERELSVGAVHLSSDLAHHGALDIYVPLVDWGVRFDGVRLPARLRLDVRTVNRDAAMRLAEAGTFDVDAVRDEARDAIKAYIVRVVLVVFGAALGLGVLMAFALRGPLFPWTLAVAAASAVIAAAAVALLLPPRGEMRDPEFYAHGPDIPRALQALRDAAASATTLRDELDAQLVGLARLVAAPARRADITDLARATIASDLHNNLLALPTLERAARGGPLLFAGDLTDRGTPLETTLVRRVVRAGRPFVFVTGNHDSDTLARRLADRGAIVLGRRGRLLPDGGRGKVVVNVRGVRIAGYEDPHMRLSAEGYADRGSRPTPLDQLAFADWLRPLLDEVDIVMVHAPAMLASALAELRESPPARPLVFVTGHTHRAELTRVSDNVTIINGGTIGGGGTGNLDEGQQVGLAQLAFRERPFEPVAGDLVEIDPANGSAQGSRHRLDLPVEAVDDDEEEAAVGGEQRPVRPTG